MPGGPPLSQAAAAQEKAMFAANRIDVYVADLREELSAFNGQILSNQTEFVVDCINSILARHPQSTNVILVGHSMGGVIARGVFLSQHFVPSTVSTIFAIASPQL